MTERKRAEERLKASLKEKEVLLREIHHRVKNNLQVVISLLRLQADNIKEKQYQNMFQESQARIRTMGLIHEKLYQSENLGQVDVKGYVNELINYLYRSYGADPNILRKRIEIDDIALGLDHAIPCGLIINELVSNSLKYAFLEEGQGEIRIGLRSINKDEVELTIEDNGVGLPEGLDFRNTKSLGLDLVRTLAEHHLDGGIEMEGKGGTAFKIRFRIREME